MTQSVEKPIARRGIIFPEYTIAPEELARRKAQREARIERCREVFELVRPELIADYYNWSIVIEPNAGDYFMRKKMLLCKNIVRNILVAGL